MTREIITSLLRASTKTKTDNALMDYLQDNGIVSDEAETISDVHNSDLIRAFNKITK